MIKLIFLGKLEANDINFYIGIEIYIYYDIIPYYNRNIYPIYYPYL